MVRARKSYVVYKSESGSMRTGRHGSSFIAEKPMRCDAMRCDSILSYSIPVINLIDKSFPPSEIIDRVNSFHPDTRNASTVIQSEIHFSVWMEDPARTRSIEWV